MFVGDDLYILYEAGALCNYKEIVNKLTWNLLLKDCTEVIWKVNANDLLTVPQPEETGLRHSAQAILAKIREQFNIGQ